MARARARAEGVVGVCGWGSELGVRTLLNEARVQAEGERGQAAGRGRGRSEGSHLRKPGTSRVRIQDPGTKANDMKEMSIKDTERSWNSVNV